MGKSMDTKMNAKINIKFDVSQTKPHQTYRLLCLIRSK